MVIGSLSIPVNDQMKFRLGIVSDGAAALVLSPDCPSDMPTKRNTSSNERIMPFLFNNMPPVNHNFLAIGFSSFAYNRAHSYLLLYKLFTTHQFITRKRKVERGELLGVW